MLAELTAVLDGLRALTPALLQAPGGTTLQLCADSTAAMRGLCRVNNNSAVSRDIHEILDAYPCPLWLSWVWPNTLPAHMATDGACHSAFVP